MKGLTEENTRLGKMSPIAYLKSPISDILSNWRLVIFSLTALPDPYIPNPQLALSSPIRDLISPIGDKIPIKNIFCYFSISFILFKSQDF